jgi:hypothetical protein
MKQDVETGSVTMIHIPNFINIISGIQKLMEVGDSQTHKEYGNSIRLFSFFQNKESRIKTELAQQWGRTKRPPEIL